MEGWRDVAGVGDKDDEKMERRLNVEKENCDDVWKRINEKKMKWC